MRLAFPLALVVIVLLAAGATGEPSKDQPKAKPFAATCPVMGTPATEDQVVDVRGKKVYFCCPSCPDTLAGSPDEYVLGVRLQWLQTGQIAQVACPLTGKPVDAKQTLEVAGAKIGFCCEDCQAAAGKAKGPAQVRLLFANFEKGFTLQTVCPMSDRPIDPQNVAEHKGKKVYFCCPGCARAFAKEPAKHAAKLPQFAEAPKPRP